MLKEIVFLSSLGKHSLCLSAFSTVLLIIFLLPSCGDKKILPDPLAAGWNDQPVCELLEDSDQWRVLKCTFPPGVGHERHFHDAHFGYTLAGSRFQIKDTTGIREVKVVTGSHFSNDGIVWHEILNIGDSTAVFLIFEPK